MIRIEVSEIVHHPREAAFAAAADPQRQLEWDPDTFKSFEKLTDGPLAQGARYRGTFKGFGTVEYEFAEYDPPSRFAHVARVKPGQMRHTLIFEPAPDGTRLTQVGELTPNLLGRLIAPMFKRMLAKRFRLIASELDAYLAKSGSTAAQ